jgi:beta-phosphoglucomutase-like phosphatase (HAD superfamily)
MARPAVIVDLASLFTVDTLLDVTYASVADSFGAGWDDELAAKLRGLSIARATTLLGERTPMLPHEWPDIEEALLTAFGQIVAAGFLRPQPSIDLLLLQIHLAGVPIGVVSNLPRDTVDLCLEKTAMTTEVGTVQCGDPSPDLHLAAIGALAADAATSIAIMHTSSGADAAQAAGLFVVTDPTVAPAPADHGHIGSYDEPDLLARLLSDASSPQRFLTHPCARSTDRDIREPQTHSAGPEAEAASGLASSTGSP